MACGKCAPFSRGRDVTEGALTRRDKSGYWPERSLKEHTLALESCVESRFANLHVEGIRTLSVGGVREGSAW